MKIFLTLTILSLSTCCFAKDKKFIDTAHEEISETILSLSERIDRFMSSDISKEDIKNNSKLKITFKIGITESNDPTFEPDINYQLVLPRTTKKLRLVIESEDEDTKSETSEARANSPSSDHEESSATTAALRYIVDTADIETYTDAGVIVSIPLKAFAKITFKKEVNISKKWTFLPKEQLKWVNLDGISSTTNLHFRRSINKKFSLLMANNISWKDQDYLVTFENGPTVYHRISKDKSLSYNAHIITQNEPTIAVVNYVLLVNYTVKLYKKWLYGGITPYINFPRAENFHRTPGIVFNLKTIFGDL